MIPSTGHIAVEITVIKCNRIIHHVTEKFQNILRLTGCDISSKRKCIEIILRQFKIPKPCNIFCKNPVHDKTDHFPKADFFWHFNQWNLFTFAIRFQ